MKGKPGKHLLYTCYVPGTALYYVKRMIVINKTQSLPDKETATSAVSKGAQENSDNSQCEWGWRGGRKSPKE